MEEFVLRITKEALILVLMLSGPPVLGSLIVGLAVSLFQATTQIQEQTLSFVPKLIVVYGLIVALASWTTGLIVRFAHNLLTSFPNMIR